MALSWGSLRRSIQIPAPLPTEPLSSPSSGDIPVSTQAYRMLPPAMAVSLFPLTKASWRHCLHFLSLLLLLHSLWTNSIQTFTRTALDLYLPETRACLSMRGPSSVSRVRLASRTPSSLCSRLPGQPLVLSLLCCSISVCCPSTFMFQL